MLSGWFPLVVLAVAQFAPYGLVSAGGGALRPDHIVIPGAFGLAVLLGRIRLDGALLTALFGFAAAAVLSTAFNMEFAVANPIGAMKNLDGLLRGAFVLAIASSVQCDERYLGRLGRLLATVAVAYASVSAAELFLPASSGVVEAIVSWYGGPVHAEGVYAELGVNHKQLLIGVGRASALFVTAPALGMASAVLLLVAATDGLGLSGRLRWVVGGGALIAGVLSNSKSFLFGIPVIAMLVLGRRRLNLRVIILVLLGIGVVAAMVFLGTSGEESVVTVGSVLSAERRDVFSLTGGRFGGSEWSAHDVLLHVLSDSPLIGYGIGQVPNLVYSDSAVNRFLLHAGLIGGLVVAWGIGWQWRQFIRTGTGGPWQRLGADTLILAVAFFAAGAVFVMPRLNDLIFTLIGTGIAVGRGRARASEPGGRSARCSCSLSGVRTVPAPERRD